METWPKQKKKEGLVRKGPPWHRIESEFSDEFPNEHNFRVVSNFPDQVFSPFRALLEPFRPFSHCSVTFRYGCRIRFPPAKLKYLPRFYPCLLNKVLQFHPVRRLPIVEGIRIIIRFAFVYLHIVFDVYFVSLMIYFGFALVLFPTLITTIKQYSTNWTIPSQ